MKSISSIQKYFFTFCFPFALLLFSSHSALAQTCSDGIQNGDETGVDCGGSSCNCCLSGTPIITSFPATPAFCTGETPPNLFVDSDPANESYVWSNGDSGNGNFGALTSANQGGGIYTVTVTNVNTGCTGAIRVEVTEYSLPIASSNSPTFVGTSLNLTETSGNRAAWQWSGPNNFTSNLQNPTISNATINAIGTYTVTVTNHTGCTGTANTMVTVNPSPSPSPDVPTLSQWGLILLALLLMIFGTLHLLEHPSLIFSKKIPSNVHKFKK